MIFLKFNVYTECNIVITRYTCIYYLLKKGVLVSFL